MELLEADFQGLLAEALTAEHQVVLADEASPLAALAALSRAGSVASDVSVLKISHFCRSKTLALSFNHSMQSETGSLEARLEPSSSPPEPPMIEKNQT